MPDADSDKRERSPAVVIAAIVLPLLPLLYVLSMGPVHWLAKHGYLNGAVAGWLEWFYEPLEYAATVDAISDVLIWYRSFWD
jgi:hypothetical protein